MAALRLAWKGFRSVMMNRWRFPQFVTQEGESLYWQAAFDALHAYQVKEDEMRWGWPVWPEAYQSVDTPEVKAFCKSMPMRWTSTCGCSGWRTASLPPAGR
jgi:4-alpha-glucanotransferase